MPATVMIEVLSVVDAYECSCGSNKLIYERKTGDLYCNLCKLPPDDAVLSDKLKTLCKRQTMTATKWTDLN